MNIGSVDGPNRILEIANKVLFLNTIFDNCFLFFLDESLIDGDTYYKGSMVR